MLAIIGGSGLEQLKGLELHREHFTVTPYGRLVSPILEGVWQGKKLFFLSRHNADHSLAPHLINYCANIWALQVLGVSEVIAVAAVGGITSSNAPQVMNVPDQIIDYTWGREHTFVEVGSDVRHIKFCHPYNQNLRLKILTAAQKAGFNINQVINGGCYAATQGPRLETAAEIAKLKRDGCDIVGMTGMPEASLAMEAGLDYACLALVVNWGSGILKQEISMEEIYKNIEKGALSVQKLLSYL